MTREELIDHLEHLADYVKYSEDAPALREAIEMLRCSEIPNSSDAINRQMAIDALDKRFDSIPMEQTTEILLLRKDLKDLPTAEPKRIRGKWIYGEDSIADGVDGYRCDHCGGFVPWDYTHKSIDYINSYNYCPYCGTDMRGGHDKRTETRACDCVSRQAAIDFIDAVFPVDPMKSEYAQGIACGAALAKTYVEQLPSAEPEIIRCKDCIYYDQPHVENNGVRYEYDEMPAGAFDALGTGLVNAEYGINIGGRCCVDYYCKNYSDDKRVFVREDNYCGRAERRTDG